jgi:hypothetical protein
MKRVHRDRPPRISLPRATYVGGSVPSSAAGRPPVMAKVTRTTEDVTLLDLRNHRFPATGPCVVLNLKGFY